MQAVHKEKEMKTRGTFGSARNETFWSILRARLVAVCTGALLLFMSTLANAIVINDIAGIEVARDLGAPFNSVVQLSRVSTGGGFCTGSLISSTTILTAKHCTDNFVASQIKVDFTKGNGELNFSRTVSSIFEMPTPEGVSPSLVDGSDLAILTMSEGVFDLNPFRFFVGDLIGELVRMVGYGWNGIGSVGHEWTSDGYRWAADNVVDQVTGNIIYTDFDSPSGSPNFLGSSAMLKYEGTTAPGDSGGPLLVNRNGEWLIAGALSGGTTRTSIYGDESIWTGTQSAEARTIIQRFGGEYMSVPEPATLVLVCSVLVFLPMMRRARVGRSLVCG